MERLFMMNAGCFYQYSNLGDAVVSDFFGGAGPNAEGACFRRGGMAGFSRMSDNEKQEGRSPRSAVTSRRRRMKRSGNRSRDLAG